MANNDLPDISHLRAVRRNLDDIARKLDNIGKGQSEWSKEIDRSLTRLKDLAAEQDKLDKLAVRTSEQQKRQKYINDEMDKALKKYTAMRTFGTATVNNLVKAFDKLGKSVVTTSLALGQLGIEKIAAGFRRVYQYQEKWTQAMGQFNQRIGNLSPNMSALTKAARSWEGAMHGLTGQFGKGLVEMQEFALSLGSLEKDAIDFAVAGTKLARGFGISNTEAGHLAKVMRNMGQDAGDMKRVFREIVVGARASDVPVNLLARDIAQATDFMARFGKRGQKAFLDTAAYVRKFGMSIKELQGFYDLTDTFDSAATAAARLNTIFGTSINSMEFMLEQDPGKRLEMVRQQLISQGKTIDQMMPQEIKYLSETLRLSEDQVNAVLKQGISLESFQKKKAKEDAKAARAEKIMQKMYQATAETMFSFSQAFDKVTIAIMKLINPLLNVVGLGAKGDKQFRSFGAVMKDITNRVVAFIEEVARDDSWRNFMKEMARDLRDVGKGLGKMFSRENARKLVKDFLPAVERFYQRMREGFKVALSVGQRLYPVLKFIADHLGKIALAWGAIKMAQMGAGMMGNVSSAYEKLAKVQMVAGNVAGGNKLAGIAAKASAVQGAMQWVGIASIAASAGYALGEYLDEKFQLSDKFAEMMGEVTGQSEKMRQAELEAVRKNREELIDKAATTKGAIAALEKQGLSHGVAVAATGVNKKDKDLVKQYREGLTKTIKLQAFGVESEEKLRQKMRTMNKKDLELKQREIAQKTAYLNMELMSADIVAEAVKLQAVGKGKGLNSEQMRMMALKNMAEQGNATAKSIVEALAPTKLAAGGVVTRPTYGLIGEAGPEAVIPLRAMARGRLRQPSKFGGSATQRLVNYAAGAGPGGPGGSVQVHVADVMLDSKKVGQALVRVAFDGGE